MTPFLDALIIAAPVVAAIIGAIYLGLLCEAE